jgi:5-methylcytosine-specific restriction protein A
VKQKQSEQTRYDRQRGSSTKRGYDSRWRKYSEHYIAEHPLCVKFGECGNVATLIDHIKPMNQGGDFWDPDNHRPKCEHLLVLPPNLCPHQQIFSLYVDLNL